MKQGQRVRIARDVLAFAGKIGEVVATPAPTSLMVLVLVDGASIVFAQVDVHVVPEGVTT